MNNDTSSHDNHLYALGRRASRNYLVNQAIDQLLDLHAWQIERVKEGMKAADEGRFTGESELERIFNKYEDT